MLWSDSGEASPLQAFDFGYWDDLARLRLLVQEGDFVALPHAQI